MGWGNAFMRTLHKDASGAVIGIDAGELRPVVCFCSSHRFALAPAGPCATARQPLSLVLCHLAAHVQSCTWRATSRRRG